MKKIISKIFVIVASLVITFETILPSFASSNINDKGSSDIACTQINKCNDGSIVLDNNTNH
ncbi:MAG: hypothetical protein PUG67_08815 [Peptoniphilaceae bacterium]|nr:hypothetical protein [Peptoniphilaceae bacterium]MDY6018949.1 hypothetical protein [Anaerococcus sp.]